MPSYPTSVPPSSIRDEATPSGVSASGASGMSYERSATPLRGFGSDALGSGGSGGSRASSGRSSPVVLVPTNFAPSSGASMDSGRGQFAANGAGVTHGGKGRRGYVDLDDFLGDSSRPADEEEEDEDSEDDEESEEEEESEDEEEDTESEEEDSEDADSNEDESSEEEQEESKAGTRSLN